MFGNIVHDTTRQKNRKDSTAKAINESFKHVLLPTCEFDQFVLYFGQIRTRPASSSFIASSFTRHYDGLMTDQLSASHLQFSTLFITPTEIKKR